MQRYPSALVNGIDASEDMLRQARQRLPQCEFVEADLAGWLPNEPVDLLFANAVFQWLPDHLNVMRRLLQTLAPGGVLAAQMPDNTREPSHLVMEEVGMRFAVAEAKRIGLPSVETYYDTLQPLCRKVEIWHTVYNHSLADVAAIVEWFRGSALRPFLDALDAQTGQQFISAYIRELSAHYRARADGRVLLRFPRLFVVAAR